MSLDIWLTEKTCECCGRGDEVYDANTTHNLTDMADAADIYGVVWRPEENDINSASDLIPHLEQAIARMKKDPEHFKRFNSPNGWGLYKNFLPWLERLLEACNDYPSAKVSVSR